MTPSRDPPLKPIKMIKMHQLFILHPHTHTHTHIKHGEIFEKSPHFSIFVCFFLIFEFGFGNDENCFVYSKFLMGMVHY